MKNQKSTIVALGFMFLGLIACDSANTTEQTASIESPAPVTVANEASDLPPLSSIPESTPPISATIPAPTSLNLSGPLATSSAPLASASTPISTAAKAPVNTAASTARLNPAHGQPGHDCSVAVGAPLKKTAASVPAPAKATPASVPVETTPTAAPVVASAPNFNANAKINPAHGQPGHDCAVAVGAPLPVK